MAEPEDKVVYRDAGRKPRDLDGAAPHFRSSVAQSPGIVGPQANKRPSDDNAYALPLRA